MRYNDLQVGGGEETLCAHKRQSHSQNVPDTDQQGFWLSELTRALRIIEHFQHAQSIVRQSYSTDTADTNTLNLHWGLPPHLYGTTKCTTQDRLQRVHSFHNGWPLRETLGHSIWDGLAENICTPNPLFEASHSPAAGCSKKNDSSFSVLGLSLQREGWPG